MKMEADKWRHLIAGFIIGLVLPLGGFYILGLPILSNYFLSVFGLLFISYGFEIFSYISGKGHYEMADAIVTIIGGIPGLVIAAVFL